MADNMGDDSSFINEEFDNNIFYRSGNTVVLNIDIEISDVNKLKTESNNSKNVCNRRALYIKAISW